MNNEFVKDVKRHLNKTEVGELTPGATGRRYEPAEGTKKLNERIHRESAWVDKNKDLPFTFSKPKKPAKPAVKMCDNCGAYVGVNKNTVGIVCSSCKQYSSVSEVPIGREEE